MQADGAADEGRTDAFGEEVHRREVERDFRHAVVFVALVVEEHAVSNSKPHFSIS
jgi:hypothetical protein